MMMKPPSCINLKRKYRMHERKDAKIVKVILSLITKSEDKLFTISIVKVKVQEKVKTLHCI